MRPRGQSGRSVLDRAPLPGWVRVVLENPIVVREWRVLRRRGLDWRIWIGVKWSLDPVVWGAPVVLSYAVAPSRSGWCSASSAACDWFQPNGCPSIRS
jgi:hypothetical protein